MRLSAWRRAAFVLALSASPAVLAAGAVDSATWEAVDKTLGRPGRVFPGDVHKYGFVGMSWRDF